MTELTGMLVTCRDLYAAITMPTECSHPSLVRNIMADTFLRSGLEWFVGIDSDIVPSRADFELLLEPTDIQAQYFDGDAAELEPHDRLTAPPTPTRIEVQIPTPSGYTASRPELADVLVCAEYAYKREEFEPVQFGGGFYRAHKSVFNILANLKHPPGDTVQVSRSAFGALQDAVEDDTDYGTDRAAKLTARAEDLLASVYDTAGTPRVWQASHHGRLFYDFYPSGAMLSAGLPHGDWKGEDHGFWTLCSLAGLVPRVERRTRLIHIGRKGYPYLGPDEGGGQ